MEAIARAQAAIEWGTAGAALPGECGGQDPDVLPQATVVLRREDFRVSALSPEARRLLAPFWDAAYDTVAVGIDTGAES